jgi:hypothetical protein
MKKGKQIHLSPLPSLPFNSFHLGRGCHKGNQHKTSIRVANLHSNNIIWFGILLIPLLVQVVISNET